MKILKPGKVEQRRFVCRNCGCVFTAHTGDAEFLTTKNSPYVFCPTCSFTQSWCDGEPTPIEIACKRERGDKPETECAQSCFTKDILNRLIDGKPLTPVEDTPDIWTKVWHRDDGSICYQCKRMSSLFKDVYPDGKVEYYDNDRLYCVDKDRPNGASYHNGFISRVIHEKYPITMPYYPATKPMVAFCTDGLFDPKNGDFDTIGIWYVLKPDGSKDNIERFFKEAGKGWAEISEQEYFERVNNTP